VYLDGEKIIDRKAEAGQYPDLARVRQLQQVIKAKPDSLVAANSSRTSAAPDVHLQRFPSVQEGLKACAQPTDQPSFGAPQELGGRPREAPLSAADPRAPPLEHRPDFLMP
jgi:hypothetical protein